VNGTLQTANEQLKKENALGREGFLHQLLKKEEDFNVLLQQDLSSERLELERRRNPFSIKNQKTR